MSCGCREAFCPHLALPALKDSVSEGLYRKFEVARVDGSSAVGGKHEECDYLVLDWVHDPFAVPAAMAYADACESQYPALAVCIRARAAKARLLSRMEKKS